MLNFTLLITENIKSMKTIKLFVLLVLCAFIASSQNIIPLIGNQAPAFEAKTTNGKLAFPEDYGKSWKVLLSHPKDFTPVCTSEILELAKMQNEFEDLNVKIAIISTDELTTHHHWKQSMEDILKEKNIQTEIEFPFIDDSKARISNRYGMLHAWDNVTRDVRGVFVIDPENVVRSVTFYPINVGRNLVELKRLVVALQTSRQYNVLTPANWEVGKDVLMPYKPILDSDLSSRNNSDNEYYKIGINLWYKKGSKDLIPDSE